MKKREGGSGRGDVGREAQANVGLRFIYVFMFLERELSLVGSETQKW